MPHCCRNPGRREQKAPELLSRGFLVTQPVRSEAEVDTAAHQIGGQVDGGGYRAIARRLADDYRAGDAVILISPNQWEAYSYYHASPSPVYPLPRARPLDVAATVAELESITLAHPRLFVLFWGEAQADPAQVVEGWLNAHAFKAEDTWYGGVRLAVYAALRTLGRRGVIELVERCCGHARRMAEALRHHVQVRLLNDVVLNQVLVQFVPLPGDPRDEGTFTMDVVAAVQRDGTCWLGSTHWKGRRAMRISICNWSTTEEDVDRSAAAILRIVEQLSAGV